MGFFDGIRLYGKAIDVLFSPKFRWFLLFPLLILILLFLGGNVLISHVGDGLSKWMEHTVSGWIAGISWLQWITQVTGVLIKILLKVLYFFLFIAFGGYIVVIVMSPIYSWLSERVEAHLTGKEYPFSFRQLMWEILRGIGIALRNMVFQAFLSVLLLLCSFIPLIGLLAPLALFLTSAYFYGFSFMDYAIERKRFNVRQSVRYINKNKGLVTGIGTVFAVSLMIPWFSLIACSFVSLLSVVAGTLAVDEEGKRNAPYSASPVRSSVS